MAHAFYSFVHSWTHEGRISLTIPRATTRREFNIRGRVCIPQTHRGYIFHINRSMFHIQPCIEYTRLQNVLVSPIYMYEFINITQALVLSYYVCMRWRCYERSEGGFWIINDSETLRNRGSPSRRPPFGGNCNFTMRTASSEWELPGLVWCNGTSIFASLIFNTSH